MSLETIILPANSISFPRSDVYLDNAFMETITCFGEAQLEGKTSISNLSINGDVDFNGHNITEVGTITSNQLNVNTLSSSNTNPIVVTSDLEYPQSSSFNIKRATGSTPAIVSTFDQSGNVTFNNSVTVNNDLNVNGSLNYVSSTVISTGNASFEFLNANIADMFDFGIFGKRVTTGTTYYDGIFRNHLINRFQIYKNYTGSISGNWINPTLGDLDVSDITFNTWSINSVPVTSTASEINALHGVTPGTATANKVLIFDSSRNIANIASLTATTLSGQLSGSLTTGTQQSITRLGTIAQNLTLADTYNLVMGTTSPQTLTASDVSFLHSLNTGGSLSVASLSTDTINPYTPSGPVTISTDLIMGSNKNIVLQGSGTVSASKFSSVPVSNANTPGFYFNGYSNTGLFYDYTNDKIGFVRAGVAGLYVNSNNDINISNDLQMVANKKITWGGLISLSSTDANKIIGITNGSALVNKALVLDSSANVTGINSLSSSVILHGDGTQALPSVSFSSDASTGIWRTSGSVLNFGINNGQKLTLSSSELKLFSANLNLNTNNLINGGSISSNYLLSSDGGQLAPGFTFTSDTSTGMWRSSGSVLNFSVNGTNKTSISTSEMKMNGVNLNMNSNNMTNGGNITLLGSKTLTINATTVDETSLSYISGVTAGSAAASKALVLNSSGEVKTINSISSYGYTVSDAIQSATWVIQHGYYNFNVGKYNSTGVLLNDIFVVGDGAGGDNYSNQLVKLKSTNPQYIMVDTTQSQTAGYSAKFDTNVYGTFIESIGRGIGFTTYDTSGGNQKSVFYSDINGNCTALSSLSTPSLAGNCMKGFSLTIPYDLFYLSAGGSLSGGGFFPTLDKSTFFPAGLAVSGADYGTVTFYIPSTGTYSLYTVVLLQSNQGIHQILIDGVSIGTKDAYKSSQDTQSWIITGLSLSAGSHTFQLKNNGKNASSSNYWLGYFLSVGFLLYRTA